MTMMTLDNSYQSRTIHYQPRV